MIVKPSRGNQDSTVSIMGVQIRAARALLRWTVADLARMSRVSLATIHRAEMTNGRTAMTLANAAAIRSAFETAGVELLDENGGGPGARLKQRLPDGNLKRSPQLASEPDLPTATRGRRTK